MDDTVEGIPVLMLANKQDVPTALKLESIKEIFNKIAERLGARDSRVLPISALEGYACLSVYVMGSYLDGYRTWILINSSRLLLRELPVV